MRFVLYNIRYGTGAGWRFHVPFPFSGYLRPTNDNLYAITTFLRSINPDIIGLIEVDNGSIRSDRMSQVEYIADELSFSHIYRSKYAGRSLVKRLPIVRQQGNALITNKNIEAQDFHYFKHGVKKLVIQLELEAYTIFLVHLSLHFRHRQYQLGQLFDLFENVKKPKIVAGDFNAFWGDRELQLFMAAANLVNANQDGLPTFPSYRPRQQFDFVLHSPEIHLSRFRIPPVPYSDHLPLVCDFDVE